MMKRILFFAIFTAIALTVHSQNFKYGISIGSNYSNLIIKNPLESESSYKLGYQFNLITCYKLNDKLDLRFEPGFVNRGAVLRILGQAEQKVELNYFSFPLLLNYSPLKKFTVTFGPEYSYKLNSNFENNNQNILKYLVDRKYDIGLVAGVSTQAFNKFEIGLRFNRGLISTSKGLIKYRDLNGDEHESKFFNQGLALSLAYFVN